MKNTLNTSEAASLLMADENAECKELQLLDPDSELAFFTRDLFAKMVDRFGIVPTSVELRHYSCISFVRHEGCDSSVDQNPYNLCNVRDSLKALNIEFTEVDVGDY